MKDYNDLVKLINRVNASRCIETDTESVCSYQDMIGHSTEEQLTELANDDKTRRAFYWIYSLCYRVDDLLTFYVKHDENIFKLRLERDTLLNDKEELQSYRKTYEQSINDLEDDLHAEKEKRENAESENERLKAEIIKLKAKLYDLTTKD